MNHIGFICDICGGDTASSSGYPLTHCHGKKMCPNCFQKWQKGLIDNNGKPTVTDQITNTKV